MSGTQASSNDVSHTRKHTRKHTPAHHVRVRVLWKGRQAARTGLARATWLIKGYAILIQHNSL